MDNNIVVIGSAFRHGIDIEDMLHALRNAMWIWIVADDFEMHIGADRSGRILEVGAVRKAPSVYIVHAMVVREKYLPRKQ